jgi:AP endonuclease 1
VLAKKELQGYLDKVKPDILCLNETKIDYDVYQKDPIKLTGYHGYWNFCKCSAGYSGVAIFSKYLPLSVTEDLPQKEHSQEGRVITIEFEDFYLLTAYIPNAGQKLDRLQYRVNDYDKCFQEYCNELKKKKTVIICGDLNVCHKEIDIARPKGNEKTAGFTV